MTTTANQQQATPGGRQLTLTDRCQEAIERIDKARQEQPRHLSEDVDEAERAIVRLRDALIDRVRGASGSDEAGRWRPALNEANVALSLVVGVEYPAAGIQRKLLDQARDVLRAVLDSGQLAT